MDSEPGSAGDFESSTVTGTGAAGWVLARGPGKGVMSSCDRARRTSVRWKCLPSRGFATNVHILRTAYEDSFANRLKNAPRNQ